MKKRFVAGIAGRLAACVIILALGVGVMQLLAMMKKAPVQATIRERAVRVRVQEARFVDVPVQITGYGEVRARDVVVIAPELAGRIVEIHPRLEVGEVIPSGEVLFRIDPRDYRARLDQTQAMVAQLKSAVSRVERQFAIERDRLKTLERSRDLARAEYERVKRLSDEGLGTQSGIDRAERALNGAEDLCDQLAQAVELYPIRIREASSGLAAAQAERDLAAAYMDRCVVSAPFDARIKAADLEKGQYVTPGENVVTLADDSILEISVPLDSREARNWLRFNGRRQTAEKAWFGELERVPCEVLWTEDQSGNRWKGQLHRVEKFDQQTRTLTVVVRIRGADAASVEEGRLPLVEGMFCKIRIPGRMAENVVKLPAEAVGFDETASGFRTVYLAVEDGDGKPRLHSAQVKESHLEGQFVYISEGIAEGELVITTRLVNPLEKILLETEGGNPADTPVERGS